MNSRHLLPAVALLLLAGCSSLTTLGTGKKHFGDGMQAYHSGNRTVAVGELLAAVSDFSDSYEKGRSQEVRTQAAFLRGYADLVLDEITFNATGNWRRAGSDLGYAYANDVYHSKLQLPQGAYLVPLGLYWERYLSRFILVTNVSASRQRVLNSTFSTLSDTALECYRGALSNTPPTHTMWTAALEGYVRVHMLVAQYKYRLYGNSDAEARSVYARLADDLAALSRRQPSSAMVAYYTAEAHYNAGHEGEALGYAIAARELGITGPAGKANDHLLATLARKHDLSSALPRK